jgi:hypothetical protein
MQDISVKLLLAKIYIKFKDMQQTWGKTIKGKIKGC